MANELTVSIPSIAYLKGTIAINISPSPSPLTVSATGIHSIHDTVALSTSDASLSKGTITTIGWVYVKNLDVTNNILIGSDGTLFPLMLKPGEYGVFRWNAAAFHAKSAAGTPQIEYCLIED